MSAMHTVGDMMLLAAARIMIIPVHMLPLSMRPITLGRCLNQTGSRMHSFPCARLSVGEQSHDREMLRL